MQALATLDAPGGPITLRHAVAEDLPDLVALLAADQLGAHRESLEQTPAALRPYREAIDAIAGRPGTLLIVVGGPRQPIQACHTGCTRSASSV
jgi:hypothetical protein